MDIFRIPEKEVFFAGTGITAALGSGSLATVGSYCIIQVEKGQAVCDVDFNRYRLEKDDMLLLTAGEFFRCQQASEDFTVSMMVIDFKFWVDVTIQFGAAFISFLRQNPHTPHGVISATFKTEVKNIMCNAARIYADRRHSFRLMIFANLVQNILFEVYEKIKSRLSTVRRMASGSERQEQLFEEFIRLTTENSATHREVGFYSDKLCITTRYLSSIVRNITGTTPKTIINVRCAQEIKMMLYSSTKSVQEISFMLHFPDQSSLARFFRKYAGMSPIEYRRSLHG